jgi:hypothetical protein
MRKNSQLTYPWRSRVAEQRIDSDGCGNTGPSGSFGDAFNSIGGGVYATEIKSSSLKIWFFPRSSIPADITSGKPNPSGWSAPFADFETSKGGCNIGNYFKKQTLVRGAEGDGGCAVLTKTQIINIDFCGAEIDADTWSGDSTCAKKASSCTSFVAKNPSAFTEAYWLFNSIKLYQ